MKTVVSMSECWRCPCHSSCYWDSFNHHSLVLETGGIMAPTVHPGQPLYWWLWARLKCRGSLFPQLCGATAEWAQTMGPCSPPPSDWGQEWRPLDMATWSLNAPTSRSLEGQEEKERKSERRTKESGQMKKEAEERSQLWWRVEEDKRR